MPKKNSQRTIRFEEETLKQMDALCKAAEIETPKLIRALVAAAHRYYKEKGHIYFPVEIRPLSEPANGIMAETDIQALLNVSTDNLKPEEAQKRLAFRFQHMPANYIEMTAERFEKLTKKQKTAYMAEMSENHRIAAAMFPGLVQDKVTAPSK